MKLDIDHGSAAARISGWVSGVAIAAFALGMSVVPVSGCMKTCTLMGCQNGARAESTLACSASSALGLVVEACRGGVCHVGSFDSVSAEGISSITFADAEHADTAPIEAMLHPVDGGGFTLEVYWNELESDLADGDTYELTVSTAGGDLVSHTEEQVLYERNEINGPGCGTCMGAQLNLPDGACPE